MKNGDDIFPRPIQPSEFIWIRDFLQARTGITLNDGKQALVMGRLEKRLRKRGIQSYSDYFALLGHPAHEDETQLAIDLLTTNETYFFREPRHFDYLQKSILPHLPASRSVRIWSAASSSGEEAYSIAMVMAEHCRSGIWEVLGSDISSTVLERAQRALYPIAAAEKIPPAMLKKYCLKGKEEFDDFFLIDSTLRSHVHFQALNLIEALPDIGQFDVIFLRNVMIYFDVDTKKRLIARVTEKMKPGAYLLVSHSETLNGLQQTMRLVSPSIYRLEG